MASISLLVSFSSNNFFIMLLDVAFLEHRYDCMKTFAGLIESQPTFRYPLPSLLLASHSVMWDHLLLPKCAHAFPPFPTK